MRNVTVLCGAQCDVCPSACGLLHALQNLPCNRHLQQHEQAPSLVLWSWTLLQCPSPELAGWQQHPLHASPAFYLLPCSAPHTTQSSSALQGLRVCSSSQAGMSCSGRRGNWDKRAAIDLAVSSSWFQILNAEIHFLWQKPFNWSAQEAHHFLHIALDVCIYKWNHKNVLGTLYWEKWSIRRAVSVQH